MDQITCDHCGDECGKYPILSGNNSFCCDGCKTVFEILNRHKLYDYYKLDSKPGIKVNIKDYHNKYAYLDIAEIQEKLFEFSEGNKRKITFFIPAIHCSSCIWLLENLTQLNQGIIHSLVNFVKKEVSITFNADKISVRQLVELLASIHYIPHISLESVEKKKNQIWNKQLLFKIGIAGFAFGNSMLFSFPEYVPGSETIDFSYKTFFGILNLLLSIPVFFYCGNDYLISAYKNLRKKIINIDFPIAIGLVAIFTESCYEIFSHTGSGYMDSLAGLVFFLLIGKWYQAKTYQALSFNRDYKSYFPIAVTTLQNNTEISVPIEQIKENDKICIRNQELIPADSVLISEKANIDYSFVTGESEPIQKVKGELIYAGGKQIGSTIELLVKSSTQQSRLTQLWNQSYDKEETYINRSLTILIDKVSRRFTFAILSIALLTAIYWFWFDKHILIKAFTSVLIVACPCALALSIPFTYSNIMRIFGLNGLYLKKNEVIENMYDIDTIVFDKTGTITVPYFQDISFQSDDPENIETLKLIGALVKHSTHPLSQSIFQFIKLKYKLNEFQDTTNFEEISGKGIKGIVNAHSIKVGSSVFISNNALSEKETDTTVHISIDAQFKGKFIFNNQLRPCFENIINDLKSNAYEVHLLSGDVNKDEQSLQQFFGKNIFFKQEPADKLKYIKNLQKNGRHVLMIGDGLNDAGALLQSNVGISIADDIYHFSPACDAILKAESFKQLANFISFSKTARKIVQFSFIFSFIYNAIGLIFAVQGLLSPIVAAVLMPLSSVTVVSFVTLASGILASKKLR